MSAIPDKKIMGNLNGRGEGVIGVMSGRDKISLHPGGLIALQVARTLTPWHRCSSFQPPGFNRSTMMGNIPE